MGQGYDLGNLQEQLRRHHVIKVFMEEMWWEREPASLPQCVLETRGDTSRIGARIDHVLHHSRTFLFSLLPESDTGAHRWHQSPKTYMDGISRPTSTDLRLMTREAG